MNVKKIICLCMSVAMAAALAVPACAADSNADSGNTTDIVLKYAPGDTPYEDYDPEADGAFTIKIPAQIDLDATDDGDNGVIISGSGTVEFSGMIGQNDRVNLSVKSTNNYRLMDEATGNFVACYTMTASTEADDDSIDIWKDTYLTTPARADLFAGVDIMDTTGEDPGYTMSENYAKAFHTEAVIDLGFENNGPNNIFGKGTYTDTLTFDYKYVPYGKTAEDVDSTSLNINNDATGTISIISKDVVDWSIDGGIKYLKFNGSMIDRIELDATGWKAGDVIWFSSDTYENYEGLIIEDGQISDNIYSNLSVNIGTYNYDTIYIYHQTAENSTSDGPFEYDLIGTIGLTYDNNDQLGH